MRRVVSLLAVVVLTGCTSVATRQSASTQAVTLDSADFEEVLTITAAECAAALDASATGRVEAPSRSIARDPVAGCPSCRKPCNGNPAYCCEKFCGSCCPDGKVGCGGQCQYCCDAGSTSGQPSPCQALELLTEGEYVEP